LAFTGPSPHADGELLLVGSSEMFKNGHLRTSGFQHDQFLLNAVAQMAYGDELATLQARRPAPRGFAFQNAATKSAWRALVVGLGPLLFLGYGFYRRARVL